jgi:hypothetical protein
VEVGVREEIPLAYKRFATILEKLTIIKQI